MTIDRDMLLALDAPLEIEARPYRRMAQELGISERELLASLRELKRVGLVRRVGAVLRQTKVGLTANALVAWRVPRAQREAVARAFARRREVTHCYARTPRKAWPYTLYTMVHAATKTSCLALVRRMSTATRLADYRVLFTVKELKKEKANLAEILA